MRLNRDAIQRMINIPQSSGSVGIGGEGGSLAGIATEAWVEENYISKQFFGRLFTIHSATGIIDPNDPDEEQTIDSIEALVGLWTEQYLSALGQGSGGGGGGGITLNDPLDAINSAGLSDPVTAGSALVWYGGAWTYSPSARLQVAGLNSSAAVSVTGSVTATSFVRQGGTSSMFLKADGSVDTTVYAAQDWVSQNFITIQFFETLFNAVDANGNKVNANTTTGIDSIRAMFGFWTNEYLSALGQGTGGGGGGVTLNQPLSSINSAGLGAPSVSGSTLVWNGSTWTYSSSIGDTKNTAGSSQQPSGVQLYLIGASSQASWGVTYSNSGCYIGTDGYLYSGGSKVLTSAAGFVTGVSVNNGNPISPVNGVVSLTDIMTTAGGTMTGSLSISGSGSHLSVGGNIGAQGTITSQDYITATGFKTPNGTSAGFLKADGSVDTTSYSTSDTLNTAGATAQPNSAIYLVGAGSYNSTYAVTYTNSGCYISADGYLYSGGLRVLTSGNVVQTISVNNGTPISPTNGNININCLTSLSSSDVTTALGFTPAASSDLANYLPLSGGALNSNSHLVIGDTNRYGSWANSYISCGAGYGTSAGIYGVRILVTHQSDSQWGLGSDLNPNIQNGYDSCIASCLSSTSYCHISFVTHAVNSSTYYEMGHFDYTSGTVSFVVKGSIEATTIKRNGGTSAQFLKADGTIDSNTYLPTSGGTLSGTGNILTLSSNSTNAWIYFNTTKSSTLATRASVGYYNNFAYIANEATYARIGVADDGNPEYWPNSIVTTRYTLLHTGNISTLGFLPLTGGTLTGNLQIFATGASYIEGVRVHVSNNGWCGYVMCGSDNTGDSGTSTKTWGLFNNDGNFYINKNHSNGHTGNELCNPNGNWGVGVISPSYKLHVGGTLGVDTSITCHDLNVTTASGSTGSISCQGSITGSSFIKSGGTSSQFLKADGSVDSNTYVVSGSFLPTTGGTLSGTGNILTLSSNATNAWIYFKTTKSSTLANRASVGYYNNFAYIANEATYARIGVADDGTPQYWTNGNGTTIYTLIHSGNIGSQSVSSASTLTNPRSLWGNTFNGNGDVSGSLHIFSTGSGWNEGIRMHVASNGWCGVVMCGSDNTGSSGTSAKTWGIHNHDGVFWINKNGSESHTGYELTCNASGNWGLGVISPSYKLHVGGNFGVDSSITCHDLTVSTGSGSTGSASIATDLTVGEHVYVEKIGNGMTNMRFNSNGNVGIGVNNTSGYLLQVNGACAGTSWTNLSDMRQKNYVEDESIELWQVASAPVFKFTWKNNAFGTDLHVGSSAQYWQTIVPEAVTTDGIGNLGLQYDVVALLAAVTTAKKVQEHEQRIEELERENKVLWNMIATLK